MQSLHQQKQTDGAAQPWNLNIAKNMCNKTFVILQNALDRNLETKTVWALAQNSIKKPFKILDTKFSNTGIMGIISFTIISWIWMAVDKS